MPDEQQLELQLREIRTRHEQYQQCFDTEPGRFVLADLKRCCRASPHETDIASVIQESPEEQAAHLALVELYRAIMDYVETTEEQLEHTERQVRLHIQGG